MIELLYNISNDIKDTIQYVPASLLAGIFAFFLFPFYWNKKNGKRDFAALIFLFIFLSLILNIAFFSREPGSRNGIDLIPFSTWGDTAVSRAYVIENILLFIPFGFLLPLALPFFRRWQRTVYASLTVSCGLEFFQMITQRGFCQTDDILTNVLGGFLGFLCFYFKFQSHS